MQWKGVKQMKYKFEVEMDIDIEKSRKGNIQILPKTIKDAIDDYASGMVEYDDETFTVKKIQGEDFPNVKSVYEVQILSKEKKFIQIDWKKLNDLSTLIDTYLKIVKIGKIIVQPVLMNKSGYMKLSIELHLPEEWGYVENTVLKEIVEGWVWDNKDVIPGGTVRVQRLISKDEPNADNK